MLWSCAAGQIMSGCCDFWKGLFVSLNIKLRKHNRGMRQSRASLVVGGAFRTARQHQSTGLDRFIVVDFQRAPCTYCWDGVIVRLSETIWFHRGQVSQQKHQHLCWRRSQTTNSLRLTDKSSWHCANVSSTDCTKLSHLRQRCVESCS